MGYHRLLIVVCMAFASPARLYKFPSDFKFGVATASYQIEGGWNASDKGENIWDHIAHNNPYLFKNRSNGDIACDSYHKWRDDVKILKSLGVNFYRFSLSWSRILPKGYSNKISKDGIQYYNNLIRELLNNKIEPMVTLYHWDLPQNLQNIGGWANVKMAEYFEDYANVAFKYFGDRVKTWITFNEPIEICVGGYGNGDAAPLVKAPGVGEYLCGRTLLLAHARAYRLYEKLYKKSQRGSVGITANSIWAEPKTSSNFDIQAAQRSLLMDYGWWINPIFSKTGDYPEIMKTRIESISKKENFSMSRLPPFTKEEIKFIQGTADFLGLNHYSTWLISHHEYPIDYPPSHAKDVGVIMEQDPSWKPSSLPWLKTVPWGFRKILSWIKSRYNNPIVYVTENGFSDTGGLNDYNRIDYHRQYLNALLQAIYEDGCKVKGYAIWSLMDNLEWLEGFTAKFGLYQVDFNNPQRSRREKKSAIFYRELIRTRNVPRFMTEEEDPNIILV